jgi:hypothetical protein
MSTRIKKGRKEEEERNEGNIRKRNTQVCGFESGRSRRIFQGEKILSVTSFGEEVCKAVGPMSQICGM